MQQPVLPYFPEGPLDQDSLDHFSDRLIEAYSQFRVTTNVRVQAAIKKVPIRLDILESPNVEENLTKPVEQSTIVHPQETLSEPRSPVLSPKSSLPGTSEPVKCFLHPKPKASCKRCQEYLSIKRASEEPSPKKPRT